MKKDKQDGLDFLYERLCSDPPLISVVTDHPLSCDDFQNDCFDLVYRLGPIYDIIRHPDTATPLSIAIYGDWGTGKSSAMSWLHGLLLESNKRLNRTRDGKDRVIARPVWFYPWKYLNKEDVWRGLIAEVIINSIDVNKATPTTVTNAVKRFGMFLGRSFIQSMAALSIKLSTPGDIGTAEIKLDGIRDILADYRLTAHPEKAFLNEFEESLAEWVSSTLSDNERLVVFIDDLDRCMPDIALQVLEALKLYLNIKNLVFVVGVDRTVISELVREYYSKLGVRDDKSRHYLAKMFQIDVELSPHELQIDKFFELQAQSINYWCKIENKDQHIFKNVILNIAKSNPREVKRLLNSALMAAAGSIMQFDPIHSSNMQFAQALQIYLVRRILRDRYNKATLAATG